MRIGLKTLALIGFCLTLVGCGNDGQKEFYQGYWQNIKASTPGIRKDDPSTAAPGITPELMAKIGEPLILASTDETSTALIRVSQNGKYTQWRSPSGIGFTFIDGVLTATRGLGGDLMNADVEESIARIKSNSSVPATRTHRYLSGENDIVIRSFICSVENRGVENTTVSVKTLRLTRYEETCTGTDRTLENVYWLNRSDGFIWKSEQWISSHVGAFTFERALR